MTRTRVRSKPAAQSETAEAKTSSVTVTARRTDQHRPTKTRQAPGEQESMIAYVRVVDGVTLNMTDYNSFRRDVGVELPVPLTGFEDVLDSDGNLTVEVRNHLDRVHAALASWVSEKHEETVHEAAEFFEG